jgi:uncharacterized membrane protein (UPF0127 family)
MNWNGFWTLALAGALCVGCEKKKNISPTPEFETAPSIPTAAQPKLPTVKLWIGAEEMVTETALTGIQQQTGMMFRTNIAENEGMIFVFPYPHQASFWMKNTSVPLSAAYIDPEGIILEIHDLEPHNTNAVKAATDNIQYVLETSQGWFKRKKIEPGTLIQTDKGSLKKTFFRQ